ncbi:MAG TPA: hypothetical protein VEC99_16930, partial [Clostridia bacterium]|nr:hypothetical protein [Clostridia bacterium]
SAKNPEPPVVAVSEPQPVSEAASAAESKPRLVVETKEKPSVASQPAATAAKAAVSFPMQQAIQIVASSTTSFADKQATWSQLKDSGKLDQAISELEQHASTHPTSAEYPAALGQAFLHKASTLKDIREQGILGMKADQTFDAALQLDPSNWDAAFWKATAMSYWPPQLNKGQEVINRFVELVKQQETQPARPEFAQSYVSLGEQYQKQGYADYAKQVWQRGSSFFPDNPQLSEKLANPPQPTAATQSSGQGQ